MDAPLWTSDEVIEATGGQVPFGHGWQAGGVSINTRSLQPGDVFVAIKGERLDGHDFVAQAFEQGAAAAVVENVPAGLGDDWPLVLVQDTLAAVYDLAAASRARMRGKVLAVTGSVGKTSTKEMLKMLCASQGNTFASDGNLNNHYGVPLSLARMPRDTEWAIFEMGMNHAGEIAPLSKLARPDAAIITTVEAVHLEFFDSVAGIADAKAEIFEGLGSGGVAVLNADNDYYNQLCSRASEQAVSQVIAFGTHAGADARLIDYHCQGGHAKINARIGKAVYDYSLSILGKHHALNSLAALAAFEAAGGGVAKAAKALAAFGPQQGRGKIHHVPCQDGECMVIDDSYNASPASVKAALENVRVLAKQRDGRTIAILGDMFELGSQASAMHRQLAQVLGDCQIDVLFTAGELMQRLFDTVPQSMQGGHAATAQLLAVQVLNYLQPGDIVLIKGSRGMKMDQIVDAITKEQQGIKNAV